jgi:hypothetical protein
MTIPDQGLDVSAHPPPAHLPKYPITPPRAAQTTMMTSFLMFILQTPSAGGPRLAGLSGRLRGAQGVYSRHSGAVAFGGGAHDEEGVWTCSCPLEDDRQNQTLKSGLQASALGPVRYLDPGSVGLSVD